MMDEEKGPTLPDWSTAVSDVGFHKIHIRGYPIEDLIRNLRFAEVVYLTLRGELPSKGHARVMDAVLCGIVDHGFFTPTSITARCIASATPEGIMPGLAGALLTVGSMTVSPQDTAELILYAHRRRQAEGLSIQDCARRVVEEWKALKKRIPGLGHPLHPTGDPRALALKEVAVKNGVWGQRAELYEEIHRVFVASVGKELPINIDGMMGCVLTEMGFHPSEMPGIAAMSFLPGLIAHAVEELQSRKLRVLAGTYTGAPRRELPKEYIRQ